MLLTEQPSRMSWFIQQIAAATHFSMCQEVTLMLVINYLAFSATLSEKELYVKTCGVTIVFLKNILGIKL
jgi:hypothetical protein